MSRLTKTPLTIPPFTSWEQARQAMTQALGGVQNWLMQALPITNFGGSRITNVAVPQDADDVVTLRYLNSVILPSQSLPWQTIQATLNTSGGSGALSPIYEIPSGTINGTNQSFTLTYAPLANWLVLHLDNALQDPYTDYFLTSNTIVYVTPPQVGDNHVGWYFQGPKIAINTSTAGTGSARLFHGGGVSGGGDAITWGTGAGLQITGDMAFGAWVKFSGTSSSPAYIVSPGRVALTPPYGVANGGDNHMYAVMLRGSSGAWDLEYFHQYGAFTSPEAHTFTAGIPNDTWKYVGFSRNVTTKIVEMFLGNGTTITSLGTYAYTNQPSGPSSFTSILIGNDRAEVVGLIGTIQQHYLWSQNLSSANHSLAMHGTPPASGLVLNCTMGHTPEVDLSTNTFLSTLTGTTVLVAGH